MASSRTGNAGGPGDQDDVQVAAWEFDATTDEIEWSDEAKRIHGVPVERSVSFEEALGRYRRGDRSTVRECIEGTATTGEPFAREVELADGDGRVKIQGAPVRDDGAVVGVRGVVQDTGELATLRQRVEVLRDASKQLMGANSESEVAEIVADASKNILGYVNTTIRLVDADGEMLRTVIATEECVSKAGERPDYPVDEDTPASRTYRTGEPEVHQDHEATEDDRDRGELMSGLYVPIGDHGVMSCGDTEIAAFDDRDVEAAELLGQLGADALTRIESEHELQRQNEQLTQFIQNMTASIEEVTATTDSVQQLAGDALEKANEGNEAIESIADQMDDIESQVDGAADEVEQLNDVVAEIDEIVDLIDDIADQTNMLALNANIEAARAGDAGAGFAVVADEVKGLAERTQDATDEIESLIRRVERHTGMATESIRETTGYASDGRAAAHTSSETLGEIVDVVQDTRDGVVEINSAMEEQADSIEQVAATLDE